MYETKHISEILACKFVGISKAENTLGGFVPGSTHLVRLHFAETFFSTVGSRTFNITINGTQVKTGFDIVAAAGAKNKAVIQELTQTADANGNFVVTFTSVVNNALLSAIEVQ
jgi:hypothetical protein